MSTTTIEKIKQYVEENAATAANFTIENNTLLFEEGLFDSMGFMGLIAFLQDGFNIQPKDDELVVENFESIDSIVAYVDSKL